MIGTRRKTNQKLLPLARCWLGCCALEALALGLHALAASQTPTFEDLYKAGQQELKAGQAAKAAEALREAVRARPRDAAARDALGQALVQLGQLPEAIEQFRALTDLDARNARAWFSRGEAELRFALTLANRVIEADRESPYARRIFAENYLAREDWPEAEKQYRLALAAQPEAADLRAALGDLLAREGKREEAARYRSAGSGEAANPCAGGVCQACQEQWRERLANPQSAASAHLAVGQCAFQAGDYDQAYQHFLAAYRSEPGDAAAAFWLQESARRLAERSFERLRAIDPDSVLVHLLNAQTWEGQQQPEPAIQEYKAALARQPAAANIHTMLGYLYWKWQRYDEALPELLAALRLEPANPAANYLAGDTWVQKHEPEKGLPYLQRALEARPGFLNAEASLGRALAEMGRYQEAATELEKVTDADADGSLHYQLYQVYLKLGRGADAQRALAESVKLHEVHREKSVFQPTHVIP